MKSVVFRKACMASRRMPATIAAFLLLMNSILPEGYAQALTGGALSSGAPLAAQFRLDRLEIPEILGRVESFYVPSDLDGDKPSIIHIQDAHSHAEAQYHIDGILKDLRTRGLISNVFVEGAAGRLVPDLLMVSDRDEENLAVADYLINIGELTGAERFTLETKGGFPVVGVEDPALYRESYEIFTEVKKSKEELCKVLDSYARQIEKIEIALLPPEIHEYVIRSSEWHRNQESSFAYFDLLSRFSAKYLGLNFSDPQLQFDWPSLVRLMTLQKMEKQMRSEASMRELETVLTGLDKKTSELSGLEKEKALYVIEQARELFTSEAEQKSFGGGRFPEIKSVRDLMEQLYRDSRRAGLELLLYPDFRRRAGLLILREELDAGLLFSEIERIEIRLEEVLAVTPEHKKILSLNRDFRILEKLLGLNIGREDFDRFTARRGQFEPAAFRDRILSLSKSAVPSAVLLFPVEMLEKAVRFYELARRRDQVLVDRALEQAGSKTAVLISGGFHSRGITEILRARGISYAVVAPKMTKPGDDSLYEKVMLGQSLEQAIDKVPAASSSLVRALMLGDLSKNPQKLVRAAQQAVRPGSRQSKKPGTPPASARIRSELRSAPEVPSLMQAVDRLTEERSSEIIKAALQELKQTLDSEFESAQKKNPTLRGGDFFWAATGELGAQGVRDVPRIEALFRDSYKKAGIGNLPLPYRAAFVLRALDAPEFAAVNSALREAYSAAPYDPENPSEEITPATYVRLSRKFSEAVNRARIRENLLIREMIKRFVFLLPEGADRALEKENLVDQLMLELDKPGSGRVPTHVFLTDLHGSTRVGALIAYALGIDNYAGIASPEELERRLVEDWKNKNPGVPVKTVREILEKRNTLIVGGSDYVDRGPKPYWGKKFNKWLRDNGILKFINGNHDLWKDWNVIGMHLRVNDTLRSIAASKKDGDTDLAQNVNLVRRFVTTAGWDPVTDAKKIKETEDRLKELMQRFMMLMRTEEVNEAQIEYFADQIIDSGNNANHSLEWWAREWGIHGGWFDTFLDHMNEELVNAAVDAANRTLSDEEKTKLISFLEKESDLPDAIRPYARSWIEKLRKNQPLFDRVVASTFSQGEEIQSMRKEIEEIKRKNAEIRAGNEGLAREGRFSEMERQMKVPSTFELTSRAALLEINRIKEAVLALNSALPGLELSLPTTDLVTQQNYRTNPAVVETALWNWKNFRLLYTDIYDNLYVHGIIPVDSEKGDFRVTYTNPEGKTFSGIKAIERIQFEVRSFFEQYDTLPDNVEFREELDRRLGGAFQVLNEWYSDVLGLLKPESIKTFLQSRKEKSYPFGAGSDFSQRGFDGSKGAMHVGHVERAKLSKGGISYWVGGMRGGLLHGDYEMSEGYSGLGAIISWFYRDNTGNLSGVSRRGYSESVTFYNNQIREKEKKLNGVASALGAAAEGGSQTAQIESLKSESRKLEESIGDLKRKRDLLEGSPESITDITFHDDLDPKDAEELRNFVGGGDLSRYYVDRFLSENQEIYSKLQGEATQQNLPDRAQFYGNRAKETEEKRREFRQREAKRLAGILTSSGGSQGFDFPEIQKALESADYRGALELLAQNISQLPTETQLILDQFKRALDLFSSPISAVTESKTGTETPDSSQRSELRSGEDGPQESIDLPDELKKFLKETLLIHFETLSHEGKQTLVKLQELLRFMNENTARTEKYSPEMKRWFTGDNLSSPEALMRALLADGMSDPVVLSEGHDELGRVIKAGPDDNRHGYVLELIVKLGLGVSADAENVKVIALKKLQAILEKDQTYHVVLSGIVVMKWIGKTAVMDLVKYSQPYQDAVVQRDAKFALKSLRHVAEPQLVRGIMVQRDERARNYLAGLLEGLFKEYTISPPPQISSAAQEVFVSDGALRSRIADLLDGHWPTHLQFIGSTLFLPAETDDKVNLMQSRLQEIEALKASWGAQLFTKLVSDWGFDAVSHWAHKASFRSRQDILDFLRVLNRENLRESALKTAIRLSQATQPVAHTRKLLQVLLEGNVLTRDGGAQLIELILENPAQSRDLIAFITVLRRLNPPDSSEDGTAEKVISSLLHADIAEVYPLILKLADSIPHANHLGAASSGGSIREPIFKVDQLFGGRNAVFHYLRLEFHREPSTADLPLMSEMLRLMLDLHEAAKPETQISDEEIGHRLGTLVKAQAQGEVFQALRNSHDVARTAYFVRREIENQGGVSADHAEYLLEHSPTWVDFSDEEKSENGFLAARHLIETYAALRARYGASNYAVDIASTRLMREAERRGQYVTILEELLGLLADAKKGLLRREESWEGEYHLDFKRHIVAEEWGFLNFGAYGWYEEKKFSLFQKIRGIRLYAERLHDRQLNKVIELRKAEGNLSEGIRELLAGMRLLVDQAELQGMKVDELKKNMQILKEYELDTQQVQNVLAKMREEMLRIYDFMNDTYSDYPGPVALSLGRSRVAPRFNREGDASLPDGAWAARVQETLLADLTAEERSVSTLRRYLDELSEWLVTATSEEPNWRLNRGVEKTTPLLITSNSGPVSPVDVGGKGLGLFEYASQGYPVPAFNVLSSRLPDKVDLSIDSQDFRSWVLKAILNLEGQTGRAFPFLMDSLRDAEKEEISEFRKTYQFDSNADPLSLSVRSGSFFSMPGMMDTILNLPINPERLGANAERFDLDNYRSYLSAYGISHLSLDARKFSDAVDQVKAVAGKRLALDVPDVTIERFTTDELRKVILGFEGIVRQRETEFALADPFTQVLKAVIDIYESWYSENAKAYRGQFSISERWGTAVVLQQMVYGNKSVDSGTAVVISSDPSMGRKRLSGVFKFHAQGPELVGGMTGHYIAISREDGGEKSLEARNPELFAAIREIADRLDREKGPQDIEITVEQGKVYLLQSRPMVGAKGNGKRIEPVLNPPPSVSGTPVAPGAVAGRVINGRDLDAQDLKRVVGELRQKMNSAGEQNLGIILVTDYVNDGVAGALVEIHSELGELGIAGIINNMVGQSSHASLIARRLGIPYVSDVDGLVFDDVTHGASIANQPLTFDSSGSILTIDGYPQGRSDSSGRVFLGKLSVVPIEPKSASRSELRTDDSERSAVKMESIQDFLNTRPHAVWFTKYQGDKETVTFANLEFLKAFKKTGQDVLGSNYAAINPPGSPVEQFKKDDTAAMREGFFIATEVDVKVVKIALEGGVLGMFIPAKLPGNHLEPELVQTLQKAWPDFPRIRALAALGSLGISPGGHERARLDSVFKVAQYAEREIGNALAGQSLSSLKQQFEEWLRQGLTTYQGGEQIAVALDQLAESRDIREDVFANHITNFVVDQIRSFEPLPGRSELRRADLGVVPPSGYLEQAAPYLAQNYSDRRWVAVHLAGGIFAVIPAGLESAVREAILRVLTKNLFSARSPSPTASQELMSLIRGQGANAQAGLEISILNRAPEALQEHLLAVSMALAGNPRGHIHEMLLGVSGQNAAVIQAAFDEDPAFAEARGRYKVSAVTAQNLSAEIREAAARVYNQVKAQTDAGTLAEFLQNRVTISSAERDLLFQTISHSGWLVHDNLRGGEGLHLARLAQSMKLASDQLRAELIGELKQILAVRKVISADSLMAGVDLNQIQLLWTEAIAEQIIYSAA